jgi:diaminohydroxyphosphoribosylaminopyrimidine deaminase/5-amino-6-(5-phosphoribosylamino)uracil reductase
VGDEHDRPLPRQPLRAVMGERELDPGRRVLDGQAETVLLRTRDPHEALAALRERDRQHVFLEGGPTLAGAFLRAGLVDEVVAYVAPTLLGAGPSALTGGRVGTLADAHRADLVDVTRFGPDVRLRYRIRNGP